MDKQPVVTVENVTKTYGKQGEKQTPALKGVSFQVEPGEFGWDYGCFRLR